MKEANTGGGAASLANTVQVNAVLRSRRGVCPVRLCRGVGGEKNHL